MSLHALAQHMQQAGRGDDKMLVHMTPREVGGLQALAKAHGGSLTINPQTGLPEAGFLSSILPMVASAALTAAGVPINPLQMAAAATAIGTATTGSLGKGLMMGLGAYSGAGMAGGLTAAGTEAAVNSTLGAPQFLTAASGLTDDALLAANQKIATDWAGQAQGIVESAAAKPFSTAMKGIGALGTDVGRNTFMGGLGQTPYAGAAGAAGASMNYYYDELGNLRGGLKTSPALIRPYKLERDYSSEPDAYGRYFRDTWTEEKPYRAPGPEYADGGLTALNSTNMPVEQMSRMNAIGANTRYPMASQTTSTYATPAERPISENVINPPGYVSTDPYTGEQRFASGGSTNQLSGPVAKLASLESKTTRYDTKKKVTDLSMLQDVYERMGGQGQIPQSLADKYLKNQRSEADLYKAFSKDPYFKDTEIPTSEIPGWEGSSGSERLNLIREARAARINNVAKSVLGRDATPEEIAALNKPVSIAGMQNWFSKNRKDEATQYIKTEAENRQQAATERAATEKQKKFEADPKNWATGDQVASQFRRTFGRAPTFDELKQYQNMNLTPENLQEKFKESDLYKQKLTGGLSGVGTPGFTTDAQGRQQLAGALSPYRSVAEQQGLTGLYDSLQSKFGALPPEPTGRDMSGFYKTMGDTFAPDVNRGTAAERLGLKNFYESMNPALANQMATAQQGMQFGYTAPQQSQWALARQAAPSYGTNISQGSASQAQINALQQARNVAQQATSMGYGPNVARAGAPGMNAPRFTSSGNIYSAGFYSPHYAEGGMTAGLGGYSDGGRLLRGPGDGVSDSIPAVIGDKQPARLADGEFVVPARIVSELGNGSTEAGARKLYAMMDRVQKARRKTTGKDKVATNTKADKHLPA